MIDSQINELDQVLEIDPLRVAVNPGPDTLDVLYEQPHHRTNKIWYKNVDTNLRLFHTYKLPEHVPHVVEMRLRDSGFYGAFMIGKVTLDTKLISALVERWRPSTHTFHIPQGEITLTLKDVEILLGIPIEGSPVIGDWSTKSRLDWAVLVRQELGITPPVNAINSNGLSMKWIKKNVINNGIVVADDWFEGNEERVSYYTRGIILLLLGGILLPDKTDSHVKLHYLSFISDFHKCGTYSWGSAVLGFLYRQLCNAALGSNGIGGALSLLYLWSWITFPFANPVEYIAPVFDNLPLGYRLNVSPKRYSPETMGHRLRHSRYQLSQAGDLMVVWDPYTQFGYGDRPGWRVMTPLIHFYIVEFHSPDRVMRQFGYKQDIPKACHEDQPALHKVRTQGRVVADCCTRHKNYMTLWNERSNSVVEGVVADGVPVVKGYMRWYLSITRRLIQNPLYQHGGLFSQPSTNAIENSLSPHSASFGIYPNEQKLKKKSKKAKRMTKETKKEMENLKSSYESSIKTLKKQIEDEALQKDIMMVNLEEALEKVSSLQTEVAKAKAEREGEASGSRNVIQESPYWINRGYLIGHVSVLKKQRVSKNDPQWSDFQFPHPSQAPSEDFIRANFGIPYHDDDSSEQESK